MPRRTANAISLQRRNLMQGVAGGLRTEFADVLRAPTPERLVTLLRRLNGACNSPSGEGCDDGTSPTETPSRIDRGG
jgi:hypothetical protein